ncbi:MAG: class I SAM-dependent methyltransferase [Bacteroidota bacterium]|nr:class I SAM-dependent methyltransferase [Bacteroidota bacterium]
MSAAGKLLIKALQSFPYVKGLEERIHEFEKYSSFAPGHYYSPLADPGEYKAQQSKDFASPNFVPAEIDFNRAQQVSLLKAFAGFYAEMPFTEKDKGTNRFSFDNIFFTYADAISMYSMLRVYKPRRLIEIGSGFSSALVLDTNELFFNNGIHLTFIEPNPERLYQNLRGSETVNIIAQKIQDVELDIFKTLEAGDFLLIDTSHVSKSGSDVNHIYFNILPYLKKGVIIHIHDIFFPFEYPEKWVIEEKRSWNEIFLLRSFLAFSNAFKMIFFNDYIQKMEHRYIEENIPLFLKRNTTVCGGMWIEKTL